MDHAFDVCHYSVGVHIFGSLDFEVSAICFLLAMLRIAIASQCDCSVGGTYMR